MPLQKVNRIEYLANNMGGGGGGGANFKIPCPLVHSWGRWVGGCFCFFFPVQFSAMYW